MGLIERVDAIGFGPLADMRFTAEQVEEMRYAALLHDFGKVAVQEKFLRKGKKLYASQMITIRQRFAYILKAIEADYLRARLEALDRRASRRLVEIEAEYWRRKSDAERVLQAVLKANEPTSWRRELPCGDQPAGAPLPSFEDQVEFPVEESAEGPFLSTEEIEVLSIRKGSLSSPSAARSRAMSRTPTSSCRSSRGPATCAASRDRRAHHEKLDGSGYPRG